MANNFTITCLVFCRCCLELLLASWNKAGGSASEFYIFIFYFFFFTIDHIYFSIHFTLESSNQNQKAAKREKAKEYYQTLEDPSHCSTLPYGLVVEFHCCQTTTTTTKNPNHKKGHPDTSFASSLFLQTTICGSDSKSGGHLLLLLLLLPANRRQKQK